MTSTTPHTSRTPRARVARRDAPSSRSRRRRTVGHRASEHSSSRRTRALARYVDWRGGARELVASPGVGGSVLVLDRDVETREDRRLIAHLAPDEPSANADVVARCFLDQARRGRCRCRALTEDDLRAIPSFDDPAERLVDASVSGDPVELYDAPADADGHRYRIVALHTGMSIPELRWCREGRASRQESSNALSVREVIAALERYEPVCSQTASAIRRRGVDGSTSVAMLRAELVRVRESPIVLNRALREAVLAAIERDSLSLSEIAMRCGRVKRDASGNESGETSWLARRLGLLPEGGRDRPTRWIHVDVLALIARDGLGVSPREVEAD